MTPVLIAPPAGYDPCQHPMTIGRGIGRLLEMNVNQYVTVDDVCDYLGYDVSRQSVSMAVARIRAGRDWVIVGRSGVRGGGYMLLRPVPASGAECCGTCRSRAVIGACRLLKGWPVDPGEWCGGHERRAA